MEINDKINALADTAVRSERSKDLEKLLVVALRGSAREVLRKAPMEFTEITVFTQGVQATLCSLAFDMLDTHMKDVDDEHKQMVAESILLAYDAMRLYCEDRIKRYKTDGYVLPKHITILERKT